MLRGYEMMVVVTPQVAEDELTGALDQVSGYIANAGGSVSEVLKDNPWGRRRLAYPIRHNGQDVRDGFFALYHFQSDAMKIADLERSLKLNDRVLRHMVLRTEEE